MLSYFRAQNAFTLLQVIIVVAILAILATAALTFMENSYDRLGNALDAKRRQSVESLASATNLYTLDHYALPTDLNISGLAVDEKRVLATSGSGTLTCDGVSEERVVVSATSFVGVYISALPQDPKSTSPNTGFYMRKGDTGEIVFGSCNHYGSASIEAFTKVILP